MKKYLFGLGAMLFGAGLMFVFTHTEVSDATFISVSLSHAEDVKKAYCETHMGGFYVYEYCKINDLTCVTTRSSSKHNVKQKKYPGSVGISCVKSEGRKKVFIR